MNLVTILKEIEKVDDEEYGRLNPRREAIKQFKGLAKKLTIAAVPVAAGSLFKQAYAQTPTVDVEAVLQFALKLEYLEAEFYTRALAAPALIPAGADLAAISNISQHENQHVAVLISLLQAQEITPIVKPTFDFSGGKGSGTGPFADVFSNYTTFLTLAQIFEDTGVRAYKGQLAELIGDAATLTTVLNIHSVEARHASHIRQMRKVQGADIKPWVTNNVSGIDAAVLPTYEGEDSDIQGGIKITGINGLAISAATATEAFDEPLTSVQVLAIVDLFIVS